MLFLRGLSALLAAVLITQAQADDPNDYPENRRLWGPTSATFFSIEEGKSIELTAGPQYGETVELLGFKPNQLSCEPMQHTDTIANQQWVCTALDSRISEEGNSEVLYVNRYGRSNIIVIQVNPKPVVDPTDAYPAVSKALFAHDSSELYLTFNQSLFQPMKLVYEIYSEPGSVKAQWSEQSVQSGSKVTVFDVDDIFNRNGGHLALFTITYALCDEELSYTATGIIDEHCSRTLTMNHQYNDIETPTESIVDLSASLELDERTVTLKPGSTFTLPLVVNNLGPDDANNVMVFLTYDPRQLHMSGFDPRCQEEKRSSQETVIHCTIDVLKTGHARSVSLTFTLANSCARPDTISLIGSVDAPWTDPHPANNFTASANIIPQCPPAPAVQPASEPDAPDAPEEHAGENESNDEEVTSDHVFRKAFPDITGGGLANDAALHLSEEGIISGNPDGRFEGARGVNRAEAAKMLLLASQEKPADTTGRPQFSDTQSDAWYTPYVARCHALGILNGYPDGTFKPGQTVNTAEFLKMLTLALKLPTDLPYVYADVAATDWFAPYAGAAQLYDLFPGRRSALLPGQPLNRFEVAIAIHQALVGLEK